MKVRLEISLPADTVSLVVKQLYCFPESGLHWHITYLDYHLDRLGMSRTTADFCLLMKKRDGKLSGMVAREVDDPHSVHDSLSVDDPLSADDPLSVGDHAFINEEKKASNGFR